MNRVERRTLDLSDLFHKDNQMKMYGAYEMKYQQSTNQLCRFPELYAMFEEGFELEYSPGWSFMRMHRTVSANESVLRALYSAFSESIKLAICLQAHGGVEIRQTAKYTHESFSVMRNKALFELRDILNISHVGHGADSVRL